jgi:uncharacterized protein YdaU (DUF1376 family)
MYYYPHHIGDFIADTSRLTDSQCMAYLRLIWHYYDIEKPLENDPESLAFKIGSNLSDVNLILKHYFILDGDCWRKTRCDNVIADYHGKADKARKSAEARWKNADAMRMQCERNANASNNNANASKSDANQEPITKNQEPIDKKIIVPKNKFSDEDKKCAEWLSGKLKEFIPDCKTPRIDGWAEHVRKMREIDNRDHKDICQLWLWCRKDSFESANVQSPEKLRSRYDSLKTKMKSPATGANYGNQPKPSLIDRFIQNNYAGSGFEDDHGSMGSDDSVIRGEVVEPVRGNTGCIGPMETDIIGDFKATGSGCFE